MKTKPSSTTYTRPFGPIEETMLYLFPAVACDVCVVRAESLEAAVDVMMEEYEACWAGEERRKKIRAFLVESAEPLEPEGGPGIVASTFA